MDSTQRRDQGPGIIPLLVIATLVTLGFSFVSQRLFPREAIAHSRAAMYTDFEKNLDETIRKDNAFSDLKEHVHLALRTGALEIFVSHKGASLTGATLLNYKQCPDGAANSNNVAVLQNNKDNDYRISFGWVGDQKLELPDKNTIWNFQKNDDRFSALNFSNKSVQASIKLEATDDYLMKATKTIKNISDSPIFITEYVKIFRKFEFVPSSMILHEGLSIQNGKKLHEIGYRSIEKYKDKSFALKTSRDGSRSWIAMAERYFAAAIALDPQKEGVISITDSGAADSYQLGFARPVKLEAGESYSSDDAIFVGPKDYELLSSYENRHDIGSFDNLMAFGRLGGFVRICLKALDKIYDSCGNFVIAMALLTVLINVITFPVTLIGARHTKRMKLLQPMRDKIDKNFGHDKTKHAMESMSLMNKYGMSPFGKGMLAIPMQIVVGISLIATYKALTMSIDMRHASFLGLFKDLSLPDPFRLSTFFSDFFLFKYLDLGLLSCLMGITLVISQRERLSSLPADMQILKYMPLMSVFVFSGMPAGTLIYYIMNNLLMYVQNTLTGKMTRNVTLQEQQKAGAKG